MKVVKKTAELNTSDDASTFSLLAIGTYQPWVTEPVPELRLVQIRFRQIRSVGHRGIFLDAIETIARGVVRMVSISGTDKYPQGAVGVVSKRRRTEHRLRRVKLSRNRRICLA